MHSKLAAAVALAKQGYRVFPLAVNGKTPALDGNWRKLASTDPARIAEMWTCPVMESELDYNIGIALPPDILVFDEDVSEGKKGDESRRLLEAYYEPLPRTFTVRSARGGRHRYLTTRQPVSNSASKVGEHIDIKSEGGFVVGPGSEIDGVPYVVEDDAPTAPAPEWLIDQAGAPRRREPSGTAPLVDEDSKAAIEQAIDYLAKRAPESGSYQVAARVLDYVVSADTAVELIMEHWPHVGGRDEEHIRTKVENALAYRTSAPGKRNPEAEFDAVEIDQTKAPPRKGVFFTPFEAAKPDFNETYLIDDIMGAGTMVVTYGDSNVGKSFVAIDQAYHIAAGKPWNGHAVTQGMVVYIAAEGGKGFHKRLEALRIHHKVDKLPFALIPCPIDLQSDRADTQKLIKVIREAESHYGQKCVLIVVDTLARAMGGGDENTSVDMSKFVVHCDRIRETVGATINIIHHTGKDKSKGARGSSALRAATDTEIEIEKGRFHVQKQRDLDGAKSLAFDLKVVTVGHRPDGKAVTACVVEWVPETEFEARVSPAATQFFEQFEALVEARRDEILETEEGDPEAVSVTWDLWKLSGLSIFKSSKGGPVSAAYLYKLRKELVTSGLVVETKQKQWVRGNSNLSNRGVTS